MPMPDDYFGGADGSQVDWGAYAQQPVPTIAEGAYLPWEQDSYASQAGFAVESPEWNRVWALEQEYRNSPEIYQNPNASFFDFVAQRDPELLPSIRTPATEAYDQRVRMQAQQGITRVENFQSSVNDLGPAQWAALLTATLGGTAGAIGAGAAAGAAGTASGTIPAGGGVVAPGAAGSSYLPGAFGSTLGPTTAATVGGSAVPGAAVGNALAGGAPAATNALTGGSPNVPPGMEEIVVTGQQPPPLGGVSGVIPGLGAAADVADIADVASGNDGPPDWVGNYLIPGLNALIGANASNEAADAIAASSERAIAENQRQYDTTRSDLAPWLEAGRGALTKLGDPNANFLASPDYGFRRSEGTRDIGNAFAARGMGQSGNALKALTEFSSNLAGNEFGSWWNRQAALAGVGQTAGTDLGQFGAGTAARTGNYLADQGDARASGVLGRYGSLVNGVNTGYRNWLYTRPRP